MNLNDKIDDMIESYMKTISETIPKKVVPATQQIDSHWNNLATKAWEDREDNKRKNTTETVK